MPKLTKRTVETLLPDPEGPRIVWDTEIKGFGVVVLPSGRLTYCVQYRNAQRIKKRLKIGVHGQITTEEARVLAKKYLAEVTQGEDPTEPRKTLKDLPTLGVLARDYIERYGARKRPRSLMEDKKLLNNLILPYLEKKAVASLSRRDIETFHERFRKTPYQANRALALLSKMISLAVTWGWRPDNPVKGMPIPNSPSLT